MLPLHPSLEIRSHGNPFSLIQGPIWLHSRNVSFSPISIDISSHKMHAKQAFFLFFIYYQNETFWKRCQTIPRKALTNKPFGRPFFNVEGIWRSKDIHTFVFLFFWKVEHSHTWYLHFFDTSWTFRVRNGICNLSWVSNLGNKGLS